MIERPTAGSLELVGREAAMASPAEIKALRRHVQIVFQDPYGSLNPRHKVGAILEEPLVINTGLGRAERPNGRRDMRGSACGPSITAAFPTMFSGGQRQRVAIARALMLHPDVVVTDEPVSALDLSIQAQVLNLLLDLQQEFGLAYLFISHSLSVVRHMPTR